MRIGYLDEAVPVELLEPASTSVRIIASNAPIGAHGMKRTLNKIARSKRDEAATHRRQRCGKLQRRRRLSGEATAAIFRRATTFQDRE